MPQGQTELEIYSTQSVSRFTDGAPRTFELQLELEHGITDRFDLGLYHVFTQVSAEDAMAAQPLRFSALKLRGRYRFAERGELPVDSLAYLEVAKDFGEGVYDLEGKAILARDFAQLVVAANLIAEVEFGPDAPETELELGGGRSLRGRAGAARGRGDLRRLRGRRARRALGLGRPDAVVGLLRQALGGRHARLRHHR
ncbi:MAG TPA: hypothetical protein PK954_08540 [Anaerolineales bacterium]|nr:hypothetical protein [Anaerolineales bacterium]